ncbi:hypothetical protein ScPMuIL_010337 [Solemya velum]
MTNEASLHNVVVDDNQSITEKVPLEEEQYVEIRHRLYRTTSFRKDYFKEVEKPSMKDACKERVQNALKCSPERGKNCLNKTFPIVKLMKGYKWRSWLPNDIICGLTVGIMVLPQGMAYAMLADLPPVVGLYMSFFPVLIYFLFGTSRHISMGSVAVVSLMVGGVLERYNGGVTPVETFNSTSVEVEPSRPSADLLSMKIGIATTLSLMVGLFQVALGCMRLGMVTSYMSDPLVSGFTTGAAVHVFTSQVKYIFGLKISRHPGLFQLVKVYRDILLHITETNVADLIISLICVIVLYLVKVQINMRFKSKLKFPIPIELIVVIIATVASHFGNFRELWNIGVVGDIPAGLPTPSIPSFQDASGYTMDALVIAIVGFAQSVSLAALLARKNNYNIDANQELVAYGFGNIFGSFFSCYPFAASVSRSSVHDSTGGKTQIASVVAAVLVLIVILLIGPLFESLPKCVLSAIIVVALRSMFLQVLELKQIWKVSVYDFFIWVVTCVCVVVLHVDYGLLIGLLFSFYTVVLRTQRAQAMNLEKVSEVDIYKDSSTHSKTNINRGIKVVGYNAPLYYANAEIFRSHVYKVTGIKPEKVRKQIKRHGSILAFRRASISPVLNGTVEVSMLPMSKTSMKQSQSTDSKSNGAPSSVLAHHTAAFVYYIIIDCSGMTFIDTVGVKILKQITEEYRAVGIKWLYACVRDEVWSVLEETGFVEKYNDSFYITVHDAEVAAAAETDEGDTGSNKDISDESKPDDRLLEQPV